MKYDFKCSNHGVFEKNINITIQDNKAFREAECPECGEVSTRILYATPSHFRGRGFFCTDNPSAKKSTV